MEDMTAPSCKWLWWRLLRMEFEHNLAQQLYVSADAWEMLRTVTEGSVAVTEDDLTPGVWTPIPRATT